MASLEQINPIDNEQAFIDEVMNKKSLFKSSKEALDFYTLKLETIAQQLDLTVPALIIKADNNPKPSQLEELAMELNLKVSALKRSL